MATLAGRHAIALTALHVNHGLSPSAYRWERHCRDLCRRLRVPLTVRRVKIPARRKGGLESAARTTRYAALARAKADFVALAHQIDDQAETVLLNLLRGAGLRGAAAMPESGVLPITSATADTATGAERAPRALRPLLSVPRETLVAYAVAHRLHWDEDESNADQALSRNWLRHSIAPMLAARYPRWRESLARAAAHFADADALLSNAAVDQGVAHLSVTSLRAATMPRARLMLRAFLRSAGTRAPDARRLEEMLRQVLGAGERVSVAHDGKVLRRYRDEVTLDSAPRVAGAAQLEGEIVFRPVTGAGIDAAKLRTQPVTVRRREGGERLRVGAGRPSRTLKNLFQEAGIPPWEREHAPLLYSGETLVFVPGLGIAHGYAAAKGCAGLVPEWVRGGSAASPPPRRTPTGGGRKVPEG